MTPSWQATASRLCQVVRRNDIVGRLAGDEFVALLVGDREGKALDGFVDRIRQTSHFSTEVGPPSIAVGVDDRA